MKIAKNKLEATRRGSTISEIEHKLANKYDRKRAFEGHELLQ